MTRILVFEYLTGGGEIAGDTDGQAADALRPLGRLMRDALVGDFARIAGCEVSAATSERATLDPAQVAAGVRAVQPEPGESVFDYVARQARAHDRACIVAPETGGLLAHFHELVGPARWLGCERAAIELATSKRATLRCLAEAGVPTPLAFEADPQTTRWVVKPDDGAGGVATRVHATRGQALRDARLREGGASTIEAWVEGEPLSVSLMCRRDGAEVLSVNRQRIGIDPHGQLSFDGVDVNVLSLQGERGHALSALAQRLVHAMPGLRGFVGVDAVWHPRCGPVVIEVNPRVTCAYGGLSAALGRNLAVDLLAAQDAEAGDAVA